MTMARLIVHVEGQTEETFVNEVLRDHLVSRGYHEVQARIFGSARIRGGVVSWPVARKEIVNRLTGDQGCIVTTMVDYYGMPHSGERAWPGRADASRLTVPAERAHRVQEAISENVADATGKHFNTRRFVPHVVMHEFEGLLFSDCRAFSRAMARPGLEQALQQIRDQFPTPEHINDSPETAPSKRVLAIASGYQKPLYGNLAILEIGLDRIRAQCANFDAWLRRLEAAAA